MLKTVALMDAVLEKASDLKISTEDFDDVIAAATHNDPCFRVSGTSNPADDPTLQPGVVAQRLQRIPKFVFPPIKKDFKQSKRNMEGRHW